MRFILLVLIYILSNQITCAQSEFQDSIAHKLTFHFNGDSFLKNNEYFGRFTEGFTGIGFILQPYIQYNIDNKTTVSLGYHFLKFSGLDNVSEAIPLFRIQSKLQDNLMVILGHLKGGRLHELSQPLYRIDYDYQNQIEYGLQFILDSDWINSDVWLHWEKFIQKNDPFPEELYVGSKTSFSLIKNNKYLVALNGELLISHLGGQIDLAENPDRTILNYSVGPSVSFFISPSAEVSFDFIYYKSSLVKQVTDRNSPFYIPLGSGSAIYPQVYFQTQNFTTSFGYWNANSFVSPRGESLFFSISDFDRSVIEEDRKLLTSSVSYDYKPFHYLSFVAQAGLYYDTVNEQLDYTYGIRAFLNLNFKLNKADD